MTSSIDPVLSFPPVGDLESGETTGVSRTGAIDLWSCSLDGDAGVLDRCHATLSKAEHARAARFVRRKDQIEFTLAHGGLRLVLARYLDLEPAALRFAAGPTGKPVLLESEGTPHALRFNLSHSHGRMLVAVANAEDVGVDLERVRGNLEVLKLAERFYAEAEFERMKALPPGDQARYFYRLWVAKEAVLKAQGSGLSSLQQCEILASSFSSRAGVRFLQDAVLPCGWTVQWLSCGPDWHAALCAYGNAWSARLRGGMLT
ncbi:MAG TPA: 4'-phosphopantetheinyl transferase superfamily protein [Nitrospira sp.]|nr:4'-phosphopantetheinyl transferase superfamily protein [Nitrospira sp.]